MDNDNNNYNFLNEVQSDNSEDTLNVVADDTEKSKKRNKNKKSTGKIIAICICVIIVALLAGGGIYCGVTSQSPVSAVKTIFSSNDTLIIGKWQSQTAPGLSAYVFYEDGTYDSYLSTVNFSGTYTVEGNKLILRNPDTSKDITYKFTVSGDVLSLVVVEEDGVKAEDQEAQKFDKVDELNQKSLADLVGELTTSSTADSDDEEE